MFIPNPPELGHVYQATTKSGRKWEVESYVGTREGDALWQLRPLGDDTGGFGGVKRIRVTTARLRDARRWRFTGETHVPRPWR